VYEVARGSNTVTPLASFSSIDGSSVTGLTPDGQGNVEGTTVGGGDGGGGTVFRVPIKHESTSPATTPAKTTAVVPPTSTDTTTRTIKVVNVPNKLAGDRIMAKHQSIVKSRGKAIDK
jgi:uncharacterized repeat protein (TIGR03803 family)